MSRSVSTAGIAAKDLDAKVEVALSDPDGGTYSVTASPVDCMGLAVKAGIQADFNKALYNYHLHAKAYLV